MLFDTSSVDILKYLIFINIGLSIKIVFLQDIRRSNVERISNI
jgi:hypothetical protein